MRRHLDPFETARKAANSGEFRVTRYRHSSVILDSHQRIIGVGRNYFGGRIIDSDDGHPIDKTVHSEGHALHQVDIRRLKGAILINYSRTRVATNLSRPCSTCWAIIKKLGFKKVFYSVRSPLDAPLWREELF